MGEPAVSIVSPVRGRGRTVRGIRLVTGQVAHHLRLFARNPRSAFSSFLLPVILVAFEDAVYRTRHLPGGVAWPQLATAGVAVFGVISVCYANLATGVVASRDAGVLKRLRGTPLPPWAYVAGRVGASVVVAVTQVMVMVGLAAALFGLRPVWHTLPAAALTLVVGAVTFSALGLAASAIIPNADAAPAILTATWLPLALISNVFGPVGTGSAWMARIASHFPVQRLAVALQADFNPLTRGSGLQLHDLVALLGWAVVATVVAVRRFRWDPRGEHRTGRGRTSARSDASMERS